MIFTHGVNNLPIPAIVYYINTLDIQLCKRGRGVSTILNVGDVFYKIINYNWANLQKKLWRKTQTLPRFFMWNGHYNMTPCVCRRSIPVVAIRFFKNNPNRVHQSLFKGMVSRVTLNIKNPRITMSYNNLCIFQNNFIIYKYMKIL